MLLLKVWRCNCNYFYQFCNLKKKNKEEKLHVFDIHQINRVRTDGRGRFLRTYKTANRHRIEQEHRPTHFFPFLSFPFFFSLQFIWFIDSTFHQRKAKELAWDLGSKQAKHYKEESETEAKIFLFSIQIHLQLLLLILAIPIEVCSFSPSNRSLLFLFLFFFSSFHGFNPK